MNTGALVSGIQGSAPSLVPCEDKMGLCPCVELVPPYVRSKWAYTPEDSSLGSVLGEACHVVSGTARGQGSEAS